MKVMTMFFQRIPTLTVQALEQALQTENPPLVLDVREDAEVAQDALPHILHIPLGQLAGRIAEVPQNRPLAVICAAGGRSAQATAFLVKQGFNAANVEGGMCAYRNR